MWALTFKEWVIYGKEIPNFKILVFLSNNVCMWCLFLRCLDWFYLFPKHFKYWQVFFQHNWNGKIWTISLWDNWQKQKSILMKILVLHFVFIYLLPNYNNHFFFIYNVFCRRRLSQSSYLDSVKKKYYLFK